MLEEVNAGVAFLTKLMQSSGRVTRDCVDRFRSTLTSRLHTHYKDHWFPNLPNRGSGYRCIRINHIMDPLLESVAKESGISNLLRYFPNELTLWIDPYDVSYRIGENGSIGQVYGSDSPASYSTHEDQYKPDLTITHVNDSQRGFSSMFTSCKDQLREFSASSVFPFATTFVSS